jgi:hypothetical protein
VFRYFIPPRIAAPELIYLPYWRLRGPLFNLGPHGVTHRFVDTTMGAIGAGPFPENLGIRPQAMTLRFVTHGIRGRFARPAGTAHDAARYLASKFVPDQAHPPVLNDFVGESAGLVYAPYYRQGECFDAVLGTPLGGDAADFMSSLVFDDTAPADFAFLPALCPQCGWDLAGEPDSLAFHCTHCSGIWYLGPRSFEPMEFDVLDDRIDTTFFPSVLAAGSIRHPRAGSVIRRAAPHVGSGLQDPHAGVSPPRGRTDHRRPRVLHRRPPHLGALRAPDPPGNDAPFEGWRSRPLGPRRTASTDREKHCRHRRGDRDPSEGTPRLRSVPPAKDGARKHGS